MRNDSWHIVRNFLLGSDPRSCSRVHVKYYKIILPANIDKMVLCYLFYSLVSSC
jgi:hypothetical protein